MISSDEQSRLRMYGLVICSAILLLISMKLTIAGGWTVSPAPSLAGQDPQQIRSLVWTKLASVVIELVESLPLIAAMWLSAAGFGRLIVREGRSLTLMRTLIGMVVLLQLNWLLAWAGGLGFVTGWLLIVVGIALTARPMLRALQREEVQSPDRLKIPWIILAVVPVLGMMLVASVCPPGTLWKVEAWGYDVVSYHLQLPKEWLKVGRMSGLHHNVYSYLPSLVETGYMLIGAVKGSMREGIYATQLFHVSAAVAAAVAVGTLAARFSNRAAGLITGMVFLCVPWTIVTATLAYNEMFAIAFGAGAMLAVFDDECKNKHRIIAVGLLLGGSILSKLTIGAMLAIPIGVILLIGPTAKKGSIKVALASAVVSLAMLMPWLLRNGMDTGNPVFPFATKMLGKGHWSQFAADRWDRAHHIEVTLGQRVAAIGEQWLCNTGYGAVFSSKRKRQSAQAETRNIARFDTQWGVPLIWIVAVVGAVVSFGDPLRKRFAGLMLLMIALQLLLWLFATHLQSRFLLPTLLPGCLLVGVALGRLRGQPRWAGNAGVLLILSLTVLSFSIMQRQTMRFHSREHGTQRAPMRELVAMMPDPQRYLINQLPDSSRTMIVADSTQLLYLQKHMTYHSAFDVSPLGELIREVGADPIALTKAMRRQGYTHVWVHFGELGRLHGTYGFDEDVTIELFRKLVHSGWRPLPVDESGIAALFELPANM